MEELYCLHCGKKITRDKRNKFCNNTCFSKYRQTQFEDEIEKTKKILIREDNKIISQRRVKKYLIKKFGDKCSICGIEDWNGKPLMKILDHIDGDHSNNNINNFRLICSNCDSQLPTYKARNKNGVKWRKKYYQSASVPKSV